MKIGAPKEIARGEARVALTPESAKQLQKLGHECLIETGAGLAAGFNDDTYRDAGVTVVDSADALWRDGLFESGARDPAKQAESIGFYRTDCVCALGAPAIRNYIAKARHR